jgi:hypothetical protein
MDGTDSGSSPMAAFHVGGVETSGSPTTFVVGMPQDHLISENGKYSYFH